MVPIANGVACYRTRSLFCQTADILTAAEQFGDNPVLTMARATRAITVVYREAPEREAGHKLLADACGSERSKPLPRQHLARHPGTYRKGERRNWATLDGAIELVRTALDGLFAKEAAQWIALASSVLVESLLGRGSDADLARCTSIHRSSSSVPDRTRICPERYLAAAIAGIAGTGPGRRRNIPRTSGTATERWPRNSALRVTWRGPRRCHDDLSIVRNGTTGQRRVLSPSAALRIALQRSLPRRQAVTSCSPMWCAHGHRRRGRRARSACREIMTELLDCSTTVVKHTAGLSTQFTGDGIMAVFGAHGHE